MKKSLLALAVLGAFAGAASAQSSVTMYGRVDLSIGKKQGEEAKGMFNGSGSRLGMRGVEDLGGGMQAFFNIEHRFDADTGASQNFNVANANNGTKDANRFWGGRSLVGLQGGFGKVSLGREYTTPFLASQNPSDPWGWDTVVATNTAALTGLAIAKVRNDSAVTYNFAAGGFSFGAQIAEATDAINSFAKKPFNFAVGYAGGPLNVAFGYEKTGVENALNKEKVWTLNGSYDFGAFKLGGLIGRGDSATTGATHKSWMLTGVVPMGQGEFRAVVGRLKADSTTVVSALGLGYHYALSKRTTIYGDFSRNGELTAQKTGYDIGLKHNF